MLELAAGIGRFTGDLADQAAFVTVVEFMETFMKANIETNSKTPHEREISSLITNHWLYCCSQNTGKM